MNLKLSLFFFILISSLASGQQTMSIKGSTPYSATQEYTFIFEKYAYTGEVSVQIAKTEKGGTLKLTISVPNDKSRISGGVYVDLVNGDAIACVDKNIKETAEGKTTSYYYFTASEFAKLKKTDIQSIRFIIIGNSNSFGDQSGYFTAINKKNYFSTSYDKTKKTFNTAAEISLL